MVLFQHGNCRPVIIPLTTSALSLILLQDLLFIFFVVEPTRRQSMIHMFSKFVVRVYVCFLSGPVTFSWGSLCGGGVSFCSPDNSTSRPADGSIQQEDTTVMVNVERVCYRFRDKRSAL